MDNEKEEILNNAASIYKHYLGFLPSLKKYIKSPLRTNDLNPSFVLYANSGTIFFKDWGDSYGNVIDFVMKFENCEYEQAKRIIKNLSISTLKTTISKIKNSVDFLYIPFKEFPLRDKQYWERLGVDIELLNKEGVVSARYLKIGGFPFYESCKESPIFIYKIFCKDKEYIKSYIPFGNNSIKFRNSFKDVRKAIHGLNTLNFDYSYVIITKSVKDELTLKGMKYNAISTQGEDIDIPPYLIRWLKRRFKYIYLFYDTDWSKDDPNKFSKKHATLHNLSEIRIPVKLKCTDISELYVKDKHLAHHFVLISLINENGKIIDYSLKNRK